MVINRRNVRTQTWATGGPVVVDAVLRGQEAIKCVLEVKIIKGHKRSNVRLWLKGMSSATRRLQVDRLWLLGI